MWLQGRWLVAKIEAMLLYGFFSIVSGCCDPSSKLKLIAVYSGGVGNLKKKKNAQKLTTHTEEKKIATVYMKNDRRALLCITEDSSISKRRSVSWNKITIKKKQQ